MSVRIKKFVDLFRSRSDDHHKESRGRTVIDQLNTVADDGDELAFSRLLKSVLKEQSLASAGSFNFVGLEAIKEEFGERWGDLEDQIHAMVRRVIERRTGPDDLFARHGDLDYLIVFKSLSKSEARQRCADIALEIRGYLSNLGDFPDLRMRSVVGIVNENLVTEDLSLEETVAAMTDTVEDDILALVEVDQPNRNGLAMIPLPNGRSRHVKPWVEGATLAFRPIWDVRREVISTFACMMHQKTAAGARFGRRLLPVDPSEADHLLLDMLTLDAALAELADSINHDIQCLFLVPVSYTSLISPAMHERYAGLLRDITPEERTYLMFEVVGAPPEISSNQLIRITTALRPSCRAVLFATSLDHPVFAHQRLAQIAGVSADIGGDERPEATLMDAVATFAKRADATKLQTMIHGVRSSSLALGAMTSGISYIDGDRMSDALDRPAQMSRYRLSDFFSKHVVSS